MEESKNNDKENPIGNFRGVFNDIPGAVNNLPVVNKIPVPGKFGHLDSILGFNEKVLPINSRTSGSISSYTNTPSIRNFFSNSITDIELTLKQEINDLHLQYNKTIKELSKELGSVRNDKEKELKHLSDEIESKEKINHIVPRICEEARDKLLSDDTFRNLFEDSQSCDSVVVSIDIRRSTELMLKARKPELFSKFITELSQKLSEVIISNYGVFDKFTGDGILAFFPIFYSGEHAIIRALKAAEECHKVFFEHYNNSRGCFNVFIKDTGLGIGIDYGNVTLVNTRNELTVVGIPVVYACRMSGAKAGDTLLNQPAIEEIARLCHNFIKISETEIDIKHEGTAIAYKVEIHQNAFNIPKPIWPESDKVDNSKKQAIPKPIKAPKAEKTPKAKE